MFCNTLAMWTEPIYKNRYATPVLNKKRRDAVSVETAPRRDIQVISSERKRISDVLLKNQSFLHHLLVEPCLHPQPLPLLWEEQAWREYSTSWSAQAGR